MTKRSVSTLTGTPLPLPTWVPVRVQRKTGPRVATFVLLAIAAGLWSWWPLITVITRSLQSAAGYEHYSHIVLLPFLTGYLVYLQRREVVGQAILGLRVGAPPLVAGAAVVWFAAGSTVGPVTDERLSLAILGLVVMWTSSFVICFGPRAVRAVAFPIVLLLFMVPLPPDALLAVIRFLQRGSASASEVLFGVIQMPFLRDGFFFTLPGLMIHIAEECSGIRSTLALLLSGLVIAHLFLRSPVTKTVFVLFIVPLAVVKNAVRIVVLSWLAIHVDPSFITGSAVHRNGGIPIFLASLTVMLLVVWTLRRCESWTRRR